MTTRDDLAAMLLTELARREEEIAARSRPPAWKTWEARPDADDREYGRGTPRRGSATEPCPRPGGYGRCGWCTGLPTLGSSNSPGAPAGGSNASD